MWRQGAADDAAGENQLPVRALQHQRAPGPHEAHSVPRIRRGGKDADTDQPL